MDLQFYIGQLVVLIGVMITVTVSNRNNRLLIESRLTEVSLELQQRKYEQEISVSKLFLTATLESLQKAYSITAEINSLLNGDHSILEQNEYDISSEEKLNTAIHTHLKNYRIWYDEHCLYLPKNIRDTFFVVINYAHRHYGEMSLGKSRKRDIWDELHKQQEELKKAFNTFMSRYNLIDRLLEK